MYISYGTLAGYTEFSLILRFPKMLNTCSLSCKTMNTRENFCNVYSQPMACEMKLQKITVKPQHGLVTPSQKTKGWLFLPQQIFNFIIFKY